MSKENIIKVICKHRCNSFSYSDPEYIIYDRGEEFKFYDCVHEYRDFICSGHFISKAKFTENFITIAQWREQQINSILEDE